MPERLSTRKERRKIQFKGMSPKNKDVRYQATFGVDHHVKEPGFTPRHAYTTSTTLLSTYSRVAKSITEAERAEIVVTASGKNFNFETPDTFPRDFFSKRVLNFSLEDVERLPEVQGESDIRVVSEFLRELSAKSFISEETRRKQQMVNLLVMQPITHPELRLPIHPRLRHLRQRLMPIVENTRNKLLNPESPQDADILIGTNLVPQTYVYMMEKDGISLSSIQKLHIQAALNLYSGKYALLKPIAMGRLLKGIKGTNAFADHRYKNSPPEYYIFSKEDNKTAEKALARDNALTNIGADDLEAVREQRDYDRLSWKLLQDRLNRDCIKGEKKVEIVVPGIGTIRSLTAETPRFTHVILDLKGAIPLTLDLDAQGTLYGLPPNFNRKNPNARFIVSKKITDALVPQLRLRYPDTADEIDSTLRHREASGNGHNLPPSKIIVLANKPLTDPIRESKKRKPQNLDVVTETSGLSEEIRTENEQTEVVKPVSYSYLSVKEHAGKRTPDRDVTLIMGSIRRFELGYSNWEPIGEEFDVAHSDLVKVRFGKWRTILSKTGDGTYAIVQITRRDKAYTRT